VTAHIPTMRFSTLKAMALSAMHLRHAMDSEFEPSRQMRVGTGAHSILLGTSNVAVFDGTRRGKAWDAFKAENGERDILTESEMDDARLVADAVRRDRLAAPLFAASGINETRINWSFRGVPFRSTPDKFIVADGTLVEFKSARSAEPGAFLRDAARRHYHAQVAVYREALRSQGHDVRRVVIVAAETSAPYPVTTIEVPEATLDVGLRIAVGWLERYIVHAESGSWPGYSSAPVTWELPEDLDLDFGDDESSDDSVESDT
jgi:hypothetical protein